MTAEKFLEENDFSLILDIRDHTIISYIHDIMVKFAKSHVEAFKQEIKDKAIYFCKDDGWGRHVEIDKINELYPTENII